MRAHRRRNRRPDPLGSLDAIRDILRQLREALPSIVPANEKTLVRFLLAVRNIQVRPATETKRGRPAKYPREDLLKAAGHLSVLLARETSVSVKSFVSHYLPLLNFPDEVLRPLEKSEINLFEAHQLARLNVKTTNLSAHETTELRRQVLQAHILSRQSGAQLRIRVKELLGETKQLSATESELSAVNKADELLEIDPFDTKHLFYEELRRISRVIRTVQPEDLDEATLESLLAALDQLSAILVRVEQRKAAQGKRTG